MLEIKDNRKSLKSKESPVLGAKKVNSLVNRMALLLNPNTVTILRKIVNLTESVFKYSYIVETLMGETIRIANYNVFNKTIKFAKGFFADKSKKYVVRITEVNQEEIILKIFLGKVSVLMIKFSPYLPIEFNFLKNNFSYEEIFKYYQEKILIENSELVEIETLQQKLGSVIEIGQDGIEQVKGFFEKYVQDFGIDLNQEYSWYDIKTHTLEDF